jgi:hypothetical protein
MFFKYLIIIVNKECFLVISYKFSATMCDGRFDRETRRTVQSALSPLVTYIKEGFKKKFEV